MTKPRSEQTPVSFRGLEVEEDLRARMKNGDSLGSVAKRDLERYYYVLAQSLKSVELSESEASLLCDANKAVYWYHSTLSMLWAGTDDAIQLEDLDQKWGVDGPALVAKLRRLSSAQTASVIDAIERMWLAPNEPDRLRTVGLIK